VFGLLGVLGGLWAAGWVSQWVGAHWQHARPAVVFFALRWLVALLGGLAVASALEWCGGMLADAVKGTAVGWLDRFGGLLLGAALGLAVVMAALLLMFSVRWPREPGAWAAAARSSAALMRAGAEAAAWAAPVLPRGRWLHQRFVEAGGRVAHRARPS
jgi:uncharacterized membrane protein required for colicin V production